MSHYSFFLSVMTADGTPMSLAGVGFVCTPHFSLFDVYCIPKVIMNLISMSQFCDLVILFHFLLLLVMCRILNLKG